MISLTGIRFLIEFSSILVLAFLCIMHEFTDVTLAKQFNIDHTSNHANFDDIESESSLHLPPDDESQMIKFTPESLDFGRHPISMPTIETVYIHNRHDEINIQMISISGNTEHFHCSFFEDKVLSTGSNTSFQVAFLARQEGLVNNTLYIHSSVGSFPFHVSAYGDASPFRVRPLIGARVPLNSSFSSTIFFYNPYSTAVQLTEMYTSGGGLHLELPDDEYEASSKLWEVPPYETRPVMKAHFVARIASNHTSYIRIRTNTSNVQLMLPVEVEVSNSPGLYSPLDTLDFGVLRSKYDSPKILPVQVINAALKTINVNNIVVTPLSDGLTVDFDGPVKLPPRTSNPYHIANVILDPNQFSCSGLCTGKVLIKSKNNQYKLSIPFSVRIIRGELYFNKSFSHFFIDPKSPGYENRILNVENRFDSEIMVHKISLSDEAKPYFRFTMNSTNCTLPVLLPKGKSFSLLKIQFTPSLELNYFSTILRLMTNFSTFDLPLYAYRGHLDLVIPNSSDQTKLDLGLVGLNEEKSSTFIVSNNNPIPIRLIYWHCNLTATAVEFVGTSQGNVTSASQRVELTNNLSRTDATMLQPNYIAVFRVHVNRFSKEGTYNAVIFINTPFETLSFPLLFNVLRGSLISNKVILPKTFPGRTVSSFLNVKSNYTSHIKLKGAFIEPKDERFRVKLNELIIKPGEDNQIQVLFDASSFCLQRICYSALDIEKEVGHLWLLGSGLYSDTAYIDKELYKLLHNQWLLLSESDRNPAVNIRLQVDGFGSFITEAQAQLYWPRLSNKLSIRFPSIRIGRTISKDLMVENPADRPILVQAINVVDYPNSDVLLQLMANGIFHQQWSKSDLDTIEAEIRNGQNASSFLLVNSSSSSNLNSNRINEWLGVAPNSNSYTMFLPPGARQRLAVAFRPVDERNFTSLLILRNNLTIIEVVMLRGEGGRGFLKIGKTLPNTPSSKLSFEFSERHLERKCRNMASQNDPTKTIHTINTLVMKEKFIATNVGRMGLQIRNYLIDGMPCEGYGFHINRCEPIFLMPNQSFDIEIVYSPDFTQPIVSHDLTIIVDDDHSNDQKFKLVANVPKKMLRNCLTSLPRPLWENFIYYLLVIMAMFVLFLSIVVAVSDAHRVTSSLFISMTESLNNENETYNEANLNLDSSKSVTNNENGIVVANGKSHSQSIQSGNGKVRNRRGKGSTGNGHNRTSNKQANGYKQMPTCPKDNVNEKVSNASNFNLSQYDYSESNNWSNGTRKKLLRQDSSSSEHSRRSSSENSSSCSRTADKESDSSTRVSQNKSDTDTSNETLNKTQSQQVNKSIIESKQKLKDQDKKSLDVKHVKETKKTRNTKSSTKHNITEKPTNSHKSSSVEKPKLPEFSVYELKAELNGMKTKARSATMPSLNQSTTPIYNEGNSISQSNIDSAYIGDGDLYGHYNTTNEKKENNSSMIKSPSLDRYENPFRTNSVRNELIRSNNSINSECGNGYDYDNNMEPNKDIWDSPITNFDSELAMNILVKQTEEFAAHDDKQTIARPYGQRKSNFSTERNVNSVTKLSDDKWEIGEWSNELAKNNSSKIKNFDNQSKSYRNYFGNDSNGNLHSKFRTNRSNESKEDKNGRQNHSRTTSSFNGPHCSPYLYSNNFVGNKMSTHLNPSTSSFSPVIGRPTLNNSSQVNRGKRSSPTMVNYENNGNSVFKAFHLNKSTESNFPIKPDLLDLDFLQQGINSYQPSCSNGQQTILGENKQNLNQFFSNSSWSRNSLDVFSPSVDNFFNSSDLLAKSNNSNMFNFENESVWNPSNSNWKSNLNKTTSHDKQEDGGNLSTKWPQTSQSSNSTSNTNAKSQLFLNINQTTHCANNRVWSPFDPYCNASPNNVIGQNQSSSIPENTSFENGTTSVFELFGGKSPWSPLGSSLDEATISPENSNSISVPQDSNLDPFDRFPTNPSPTSSSSSTNHSSTS